LVETAHTNIPLAMLIVFASAKLMAELFERLGQPGLVGEILAGVLIGPSVLHWIAPTDFLTALSDLGAMFLLFRVGLEVKSSELLKLGGTATLVAVSGVIVPFLMGWGILLAWGATANEAIFVGARWSRRASASRLRYCREGSAAGDGEQDYPGGCSD